MVISHRFKQGHERQTFLRFLMLTHNQYQDNADLDFVVGAVDSPTSDIDLLLTNRSVAPTAGSTDPRATFGPRPLHTLWRKPGVNPDLGVIPRTLTREYARSDSRARIPRQRALTGAPPAALDGEARAATLDVQRAHSLQNCEDATARLERTVAPAKLAGDQGNARI